MVELRVLMLIMLVCKHIFAAGLPLVAQCVGKSRTYWSHMSVVLCVTMVHSLPAHQLLITSKLP